MLNLALFRREMRASVKTLLIFGGVIAMYFAVIVTMFDPEMGKALNELAAMMPELMAMFGMSNTSSTLVGFLASYLYGFLMLVMPMVFSVMCANRLVARHVDRGSMTYLLSAPVKRSSVALTQLFCLVSCVCILVAFSAAVGVVCCQIYFPGELDLGRYMLVNAGVLCLQLFIAGICFFFSCMSGDTKISLGLGAGIPALSYIIHMAAGAGPELEKLKYASFFTLYGPDAIAAGETGAMLGPLVLLASAVALFAAACYVFCKKDLYI